MSLCHLCTTQPSALQQTLACSILTALLSEFSSSSKTSSIGLSMEFHGNCKRLFQVRFLSHISQDNSILHFFLSKPFSPSPYLQEDGLRQIFMMTMEVLQEFNRRENLNAQMSCVFQRFLSLANQVLSWNFLPPNHILFFYRRVLLLSQSKWDAVKRISRVLFYLRMCSSSNSAQSVNEVKDFIRLEIKERAFHACLVMSLNLFTRTSTGNADVGHFCFVVPL